MADPSVQRRLAAILAADVAGYSRLVEQDEAGTLAALRERRKSVLDPTVARHHGRVVKVMGDGVLVEFGSAVNAVACAVELQRQFAAANESLAEDRRIVLRVGVNLGDVVVEGGDLYGDGVIIAVRLQTMAEPGGICISGGVHEQVAGKLDAAFDDLGLCEVKNSSKPVHVYRARPGGDAAPVRPALALPDKPSIAVLPFQNMSGGGDQQYFSDGVTEDIITELSRFRLLHVVARNSSFRYRGMDLDMTRIGRELGVQYLVEGSVRRMGDRVRITAQLIDALTGNHVWAERFDRNQDEIFAVQDQVVRTIAGTLVGRVEAAVTDVAKRKPPASLMAYDYVLRGLALPVGDSATELEARRLYEKAIELDPAYGLAHAMLAYTYVNEWTRDETDSRAAMDRALVLARKAVSFDETSTDCCLMLAWVYVNHRSFDLAEQYYRRALELNPSYPFCYSGMAEWLTYMGRTEEAMKWFDQVKLVDPHFNPPWWWRTLGTSYFVARKYAEAIVAFNRSPVIADWVHAYLAASHAYLGRTEDAKRHAAEALRLLPTFSIARLAAKEPFAQDADRQHLIDGLRLAGLPE